MIKINSLSKSFGEKKVLENLNLEVKNDEILPFSAQMAAEKLLC